MIRKIRSNVFETNSSSVHSIVIDNSGREKSKLPLDDNGDIIAYFGQFGKDEMIYDSQEDKLSYILTCLYYLCEYDVNFMKESYRYEMVRDVICKYAGAKDIDIREDIDPELDHQSIPYGDIDRSIVNIWNDDSIINFVFNKYIKLETRSD